MRSLVQTSAPSRASCEIQLRALFSQSPTMETAQPPQATCAATQLSVLRVKTLYPNQCELLSFQLVSTVSWPSTTEKSLQ